MTRKFMNITVYDVGHGLSISIILPNNEVHWIDAGCTAENHPIEDSGINHIHRFILSHFDEDHYAEFKGRKQLFNRSVSECYIHPCHDEIDLDTILEEEMLPTKTDEYAPVIFRNQDTFGQIFYAREADISESLSSNDNNLSAVVFYKYGKTLFVVPGDIEEAGWKSICKSYRHHIIRRFISDADYRILLAPHHGSKNTYIDDLMTTINPTHIIISANETDVIHPKYETDIFYNTAYDGTIHIKYSSTSEPKLWAPLVD